MRILIIDDDALVAESLRASLEGHDIAVASEAMAARDLLHRGAYDAVICDLMMPDRSGIELYRELSESRPELAERIVFVTGGAYTNAAQQFLQTSVQPFLEKPFTEEEIRAALEQVRQRSNPPSRSQSPS